MKTKFENIKLLWNNNVKVAHNYFFMTSLQVAVILINLLLYPYLIRTLGKDVYGTYIFIFSNVQFFVLFFASGLSMPALKQISLNSENQQIKNKTISEVFCAKLILYSFCAVLLFACCLSVPFVKTYFHIYAIILFTSAFGDMLFPLWYFQGMQQMSYVTYFNLSWRLASIPLIFIFVKSSNNLFIFTLIMTVLPFMGNVFTYYYLKYKKQIRISIISFGTLKSVFREALPFYWTSAFIQLKDEGVKFVIGVFWGMNNVAVYDLANKITNIAAIFTGNINTALFPKAITNLTFMKIKRIFRYESIIGSVVVVLVIIFGYWAVILLGGRDMLEAYPLLVILSFTILFSLLTNCYVNYVFVPKNRYYLITKKQIVSLLSFFISAVIGLFIYKHIFSLVFAITFSSLLEMLYCKYLTARQGLLKSDK